MTELLPNRLFETFFVVMAIMFAAYVVKGVMYYSSRFWATAWACT